MTAIYRTRGKLDHPVSDLHAAREFLKRDDMTQFIGYHHSDLPFAASPENTAPGGGPVVHVAWDLISDFEWEVQVIANRPLTEDEATRLSDWICGQNSDGLGEGFEQQSFACPPPTRNQWGDIEDDGDEIQMSSFDWQSNDCKLVLQ